MNKQLKSLTWKYFWKRKRKEISEFIEKAAIFSLAVQMFFTLAVGLSLSLPIDDSSATNPELGKILLLIFSIELGIILLIAMGKSLIKWLRSNWKLATKDAIEELNRNERRKK